MSATLATLYPQHVQTLIQRATHALTRGPYDHLIVAAGKQTYRFLDDNPNPFYANPQFKAWVPLLHHPESWIVFTPGAKPILVYYQPADYWHVPPSAPAGYWVEQFDVRIITEPDAMRAHLPKNLARAAILGEASSAIADVVPNNPQTVLDSLHMARTRKTPYELQCLREASTRAVRAHRAAATAFRERLSEQDIHVAYCEAAGQNELELPYNNIVGLNEHGAILHYQYKERARPTEHRSLLIDAGAQVHGYAADITRTYGNGDAEFTHLLEAVNHAQLALCQKVRVGQDYPELHVHTHELLARILREQDIVRMTPEAMIESGVSSVFFPHGLGHFLGLQVHDVGAFLRDESGATIPKPAGHPYLRLTRKLEADNVLTIEPGIYFIDLLLDGLRQGPHARSVNWDKVAHLHRFGGIRIEDNVRVTEGEPENMTRDAQRALAA